MRKIFLVIIGFLLITNIVMLIFFIQKKPPERHNNRSGIKAYITNILKNDVGFNEQQIAKYDTLSNMHRTKIRQMSQDTRDKKEVMFKKMVAGNFTDSTLQEVASQSAAFQKIMETQMLTHVRNIRMLCTPEQIPRFDSSFIKVFNKKGRNSR